MIKSLFVAAIVLFSGCSSPEVKVDCWQAEFAEMSQGYLRDQSDSLFTFSPPTTIAYHLYGVPADMPSRPFVKGKMHPGWYFWTSQAMWDFITYDDRIKVSSLCDK